MRHGLPALRAAVVLALLAASGVQAQGQAALPDLEVLSVTLDAEPAVVEGVRGTALVHTVVRNGGMTPVSGYQLTYWWVPEGGAAVPLNEAESATASRDAHEERLDPNQRYTHEFTWRLQPGQAGPGTVRVVVHVAGTGTASPGSGDADPADNSKDRAVEVRVHAMAFEALGGPQSIHPDETVFVRLQARNLGNVAEPVSWQVLPRSGAATRLAATLDATSLQVPPGGRANVTLYVSYPYESDASPFSVQVTVRAQTGYGRSIDVATPSISSTDTRYDLARFASVVGGGPSDLFSDGTTVSATWTLRNTGAENDTFSATVGAGPGWDVVVSPARVALHPGEAATLRVAATPSVALAPGSRTPAALTVASDHPVAPTTTPFALRASGPAVQVVRAQVGPEVLYRGDEASMTLELRNDGDRAMPERTLGSRLTLSDGSWRHVDTPVGRLEPGASATLEVPLGVVGRPGPAEVLAAWINAPNPALAALDLEVRQPALVMLAPERAAGVAGEGVAYAVPPHTFRVRNDGAFPETVVLAAAAQTGSAEVLGATEVLLAPGEERSVPVQHRLPHPAGRDTASNLTVTAAVKARPAFAAAASVATRIDDRVGPQVKVSAQPAHWPLAEALEVFASASDAGATSSVAILVTPPTGANATVAMLPDGNGTWRGLVRFAAPGAHRLQVQGTDAAGNRGAAPPWTVHVAAGSVPRITAAVPVGGAWDPARPVNVTVASATSSHVTFTLRQGGAVAATGTVPLLDGKASVPLTGAAAGDAILLLAVGEGAARGETAISLHLTQGTPPPSPGSAPSTPIRAPQQAPGPGLLWAAMALALAARRSRW